jgi:quercetin dioxygenase-like cupin family protein
VHKDENPVHPDPFFEIFLVARGTSVICVEKESVELKMGDVIVVNPGEAHTFLSNSGDYYHFVFQAPRKGQEFRTGDKALVERSCLGL